MIICRLRRKDVEWLIGIVGLIGGQRKRPMYVYADVLRNKISKTTFPWKEYDIVNLQNGYKSLIYNRVRSTTPQHNPLVAHTDSERVALVRFTKCTTCNMFRLVRIYHGYKGKCNKYRENRGKRDIFGRNIVFDAIEIVLN